MRPWGNLLFSFYNSDLPSPVIISSPSSFILNIIVCFAMKKMGKKNLDIYNIEPDISFHMKFKIWWCF